MTLGTITVNTRGGDDPAAPIRQDAMSIQGDDSYPTGGTPAAEITPLLEAQLGVDPTILDISGMDTTGRYALDWDSGNQALKVIDLNPTPPAEVSPGDISSLEFNALVVSK